MPGPLPLLHVRRPCPAGVQAPYLSPDEVLDDRPRGRGAGLQGGAVHPRRPAGGPLAGGRASGWTRPATTSTLDYVRAMAIRVLEETGLLPHLNPGVMTLGGAPAAQAGRAVHGDDAGDHGARGCGRSRAGRTSARRTRSPPSGCGCSRTPAASHVPFTTGMLIGIGETLAERVDSLFAIAPDRAAATAASRK